MQVGTGVRCGGQRGCEQSVGWPDMSELGRVVAAVGGLVLIVLILSDAVATLKVELKPGKPKEAVETFSRVAETLPVIVGKNAPRSAAALSDA